MTDEDCMGSEALDPLNAAIMRVEAALCARTLRTEASVVIDRTESGSYEVGFTIGPHGWALFLLCNSKRVFHLTRAVYRLRIAACRHLPELWQKILVNAEVETSVIKEIDTLATMIAPVKCSTPEQL